MNRRLKQLIDEKGISQREFANLIGITETSLSRYIKGGRVPRANIAVKMAEALCVDLSEIYNTESTAEKESSLYIAVGKRNGSVIFWHYDTPETVGYNTRSLLKTYPDVTIEIRNATEEERKQYG